MEKLITPKKIESIGNVKNASKLLKGKFLTSVLRFDEQWKTELTEVGGKASLVIDFGKEMNGGVKIITGFVENMGISARIRFGESKSEVFSDIGVKGATNDHSPRDFNVILPAFACLNFGETGFRFVRLDFDENAKAVLQDIYCVNHSLSQKQIYGYNGTDALIKRIFDTAKRTVNLCAAGKYLVDGIKRDRLVWIGDLHPEMLALTTLYGRLKVVEDSLEYMRKATPKGQWMNGSYPSYSMWWIIIMADYFQAVKCADFAEKQLGYIEELISLMNEYVGEDGTMNYPYYFVDWASCDTPEVYAGVRAINMIAAQKAIGLFKEFGKEIKSAETLLNKLKKQPISGITQKQIVALKYFAEGKLCDGERKILTEGNSKGISTFMSYYVLKAIAAFDREKAIEIMKEYFGAMLDKGATTFWEDFNIEWVNGSCRIDELPKEGEKDIHGDFGAFCYVGFRHSLCHGWSSGIIKFIKDYC